MKLSREEQVALVSQAATGDQSAIATLYTTFAQTVRWAIMRLVPDDDVEDYVQSIFIHVFERLDSYKGDAEFSTWLYRVARNYVLQSYRSSTKRRAEKNMASLDETYETASGDTVRLLELGYEDKAIEGHIANKELYAAIEQLKPREALFIKLDLQGYSNEEVAEKTGSTIPMVKAELHRGKVMLGELLRTTRRIRRKGKPANTRS